MKYQGIKLEIKKAGINGEGIGFYQRKPVFVEGCFPGEVALCNIYDEGRHDRGELIKVLKRSKDRIKSPCPHFRKCGGCSLINLNYEKQLEIKKQLLQDALYKYAGYNKDIEDVVASTKIYHYRNKCNLPFVEHDGKLVNAIYKQGTNHPTIIEHCIIHDEKLEELRITILNILNIYRFRSYVHSKKQGMRQLVLRGFENEYQLVLITGNDIIDQNVIDELSKIKELVSIFQGVNIHKNPIRMMPDKLRLLYGKEKIVINNEDYKLHLSPKAFYQLNHFQATRIYKDVAKLITEKCDLLVEAYCGIGTISMYLADKAEKIIGIEIEERAIKDAKENAKLNGFNNMEFIADDASAAIRRIVKKKKIDVLIVDPPRTGLDDELLETLMRTKIKKIVYVSCNPATLAKNLAVLQNKYHIELIRPYDMFPDTSLVETVCLLYHQKKDFIFVPYEPKDAEYLKK